MNGSIIKKDISISGQVVRTDWRDIRVVPQEMLNKKIRVNDDAKQEVRKQRETKPQSINKM